MYHFYSLFVVYQSIVYIIFEQLLLLKKIYHLSSVISASVDASLIVFGGE
jgi:hypothetical protein